MKDNVLFSTDLNSLIKLSLFEFSPDRIPIIGKLLCFAHLVMEDKETISFEKERFHLKNIDFI